MLDPNLNPIPYIEDENILIPDIQCFEGNDWHVTNVYKRNLPHWELKGSTYFITASVDSEIGKPFKDPDLAKVVINNLCRKNKTFYDLYAFVIMPTHIHILLKPLWGKPLKEIMKNLKGGSAFEINRLLNRTGKFWQQESFDHLIRHGLDFRDKWEYIKQNPVKAKLVDNPKKYPFSSFYDHSNSLQQGL